MRGRSLIGSSPRRARRRGIQLHARASAATRTSVTFEDSASLEVATVIWATGFDLDHSWVDAPAFDADGAVLHERGVTPCPGLYFLGLPWQYTRESALLGWVKDDAEYLAQLIARRHAHSPQRLPATTP
jgi:putative flavoprotein involved in K+ transport